MNTSNRHVSQLNRLCKGFFLLILLGDVNSFITPCHRSGTMRNDCFPIKVDVPTTKSRTSKLYWGFFRRDDNSEKKEELKIVDKDTTNVVATAEVDVDNTSKNMVTVVEPPKVLSPEEEAARLRSEAAKSRLEAERMDAELTLRKIEKLERALKKQQMEVAMMNESNMTAATSTSTTTLKKSPEDIQREIDGLLRKVRGEAPTPTTTTTFSASTDTTATVELIWPNFTKPYDEEACQACRDVIKAIPQFLLAGTALQLELELEIDNETKKTKPIDKDKLAMRLDQLNRLDFSYSKKKPPTFSRQQIAVVQKEVEAFMASDEYTAIKVNDVGSYRPSGVGDDKVMNALFRADDVNFMIKSLKGDAGYQTLWDAKDSRSIAQLILEYQYYVASPVAEIEKVSERMLTEAFKDFASASNTSVTNSMIETLYPKCTTKKDIVFDSGGDKPSPIPTEAAVKKLISDVLPKANFQTTSKPEPVLGGYIVRGTTKLSGDAFIDQLDKVMEQSNLKTQMSVFYVNEVTTYLATDDESFDSFSKTATSFAEFEPPPILYVTSVNVCREPIPIRLSIVSAFGLATSWYFSIYPFLLNPSIATRVDEQLAIADANMVPDLSWLSDLSLPLFATFMIIQLSHELGHLIVAGANGIKTSPPTFVPSLFTGLTSTVTTFRTPPKNTATMFDYAAAGPMAGIITSILAIAVGCQITSVTPDMSLFPSLPLEILRQSTLGGGIIEFVLGTDVLSLPKAAIGTAAVAGMTVPLHPIAVAGFISLIINALAVLPIGTTDGGRIAISLFGRAFKISVATLAQIAILFLGSFGGSDLFLYYFLFCVIFQRGNEIPARNEVDKLDLARCFVAGGLYIIAALTLIPFQ